VFGDGEQGPWVTATKSLHGHALGASGALEAAAAVLGLGAQGVPGTANFLGQDPGCAVRLAVAWQDWAHEAAMSNSFAFGGLNAVLVFRRGGARN
jgi:nodulation protein E